MFGNHFLFIIFKNLSLRIKKYICIQNKKHIELVEKKKRKGFLKIKGRKFVW
jgi:hypothetical protein